MIELHSCMYIARFATVRYTALFMPMYTPSKFLIDFKRTFESLVLSSQIDEKDNEKNETYF